MTPVIATCKHLRWFLRGVSNRDSSAHPFRSFMLIPHYTACTQLRKCVQCVLGSKQARKTSCKLPQISLATSKAVSLKTLGSNIAVEFIKYKRFTTGYVRRWLGVHMHVGRGIDAPAAGSQHRVLPSITFFRRQIVQVTFK